MERRKTQKLKVDNQFNNLVVNALDFLKKSLEEIDASPKRTIIDFYTAVELFIKARLMKEHWSLIITKSELANSTKFLEGDFQSVSLKDARERLKNIIGQDDIGNDAFDCFKEIGNHRNRLVHFHNKNVKLKEIVVKDVLKGLYFLDVLLNKKWKLYFEPFKHELDLILKDAHQLRDFLKAKFNVLLPEIEQEKAKAIPYNKCLSCGFESAKKVHVYEKIFSSVCKVCGFEENCVQVDCPNCRNKLFVSEGFRDCDFCNHPVQLEDIVEQFKPEDPYDKRSLAEYEYKIKQIGLCDECGWLGDTTVHPMDENFQKWFCISCNKTFDTMAECSNCATLFPFDLDTGLICSNCS